MTNIHYFGIRHHGVGSTKRLLSALNRLNPTKILIEGPSDCNELLPLLAHPQMKTPVALLAYASELPECHFYYPFAQYSPEYQACLWAVSHGVDVALIDLPTSVMLAGQIAKLEQLIAQEDVQEELKEALTPDLTQESTKDVDDHVINTESEQGRIESDLEHNLHDIRKQELERLRLDPIGMMGRLAGYKDGESFWNDVIEQSADDDVSVFGAIAQMMRALRQRLLDDIVKDEMMTDEDEIREAFMRQEIRRHAKDMGDDECMAVVCGAWHVPALDERLVLTQNGQVIKHTIKSDATLLKGLPKKLPTSKLKTTWIPYTTPRLARFGQAGGYGAGVDAPMWYQHLWENKLNVHEKWLTNVATALRGQGQNISTASIIEATRLAQSLATVRGRRVVGFEELCDAVVSCLCFGEEVLWRSIAHEILLGKEVGGIPDDLPLTPLLEDLERLKKQTKLKAESTSKEVDFDLRSDIGLKKSHLLHRLTILGVPWGKKRPTGSSRGTFRERWEICWHPEFSIMLIENLIYGNTIFEASANALSEKMEQTHELGKLAEQVQSALESGLDKSAMTGIKRLSEQATHTDNVMTLLQSLSPLIHLQRYGTARKVALDKVGELVYELMVKASVGLPFAIKNINDDEATDYHQHMTDVHGALKIAQNDELTDLWWQALTEVVGQALGSGYAKENVHLQVVGLATRLLYQNDKLSVQELTKTLQKTLSPAVEASQSARFFEGFFSGSTDQLLYDKLLLTTLETWILSLDETDFTEYLPLFRRVFSMLDSHERKRLLEVIFGRSKADDVFVYHEDLEIFWQRHLDEMQKILT